MPVLAVAAFACGQRAKACFEEHSFELAYFQRHERMIALLWVRSQVKIVQKTRKK